MSLVVQKFGGSSVADTHHLFNVAKKITSLYQKGNDIIVVVSAQGDTTDKLTDLALEISPCVSKREKDVLLSVGEQISSSLLAMAIKNLGFPAISLSGAQAGIYTDSCHGNAKITKILTSRIKLELKKKNIVVVAGFQGINSQGDITTLGRGGSDTSAVALAGAVNADICKIYTDVSGIYTADPRTVPSAKKINIMSYDEMLYLSSLGAQVLSKESILEAQKNHVEIEVLSSMGNEICGTTVKGSRKKELKRISGIATEKKLVRIFINGIKNADELKKTIFPELISAEIITDENLRTTDKISHADISFVIEEHLLQETLGLLNKHLHEEKNAEIFYEKNRSKISVVNLSNSLNIDIASIIFETLHEANINIEMIACDSTRVSVILESLNLHRAVNAIHRKLFEEDNLLTF